MGEKEKQLRSELEKITLVLKAALRTLFWSTAFLLLAAYLGNYWLAKDILVLLALFSAVRNTGVAFFHVLPIGEALALLFHVAKKEKQEAIAKIPSDLDKALRKLAWVFSSEFVVALIVWWFPFHTFPRLIPWFFVATQGAMFWAIYEEKGSWWTKILGTVSVCTIIILLVSFIVGLSPWATAYFEDAGKWWTGEPQQAVSTNRGQQNQMQAATVVPEPQARELPDGTVEMELGARFILGAGIEKTFSFGPLGVVLTDGEGYTIVCDVPCKDRNGRKHSELVRNVSEWISSNGGKPCYTEPDPFRMKLRADPSADLRFRARTPKDPPCNA